MLLAHRNQHFFNTTKTLQFPAITSTSNGFARRRAIGRRGCAHPRAAAGAPGARSPGARAPDARAGSAAALRRARRPRGARAGRARRAVAPRGAFGDRGGRWGANGRADGGDGRSWRRSGGSWTPVGGVEAAAGSVERDLTPWWAAGGESDASGGPNHRLEDGDARSEVNAIAVAAVRKEKDFDEKVQGGVSVDEDDDLGAVETGAEEKDEEMAVAEDVAVDVVGNEVEDAESSSSVSTVVAEATASQDDVAAQEPLIATPQQLLDQQLTAEMWLQGVNSLHDALHPSEDQVNTSTATPSAAGQLESCSVAVALDQSALLLNWPSHLEERRRVWFSAPNSLTSNRTRTVIYWMQNCFRVENSNFALESAVMLAKRLQAPLMIVTLVRSSVVYPVCHAPTASDAYLRWCLLEISDRCAEANVPLHAVTSTWSSTDSASRSELSNALEWTRHPLFTALDAFHPNIVVTDTPFDATSGGDVTRLAQHMEANQSLSPWTLISVDSSSYIPIHNISMHARASLEPKAPVLSEDEFGNEYSNAQVHMSRQGFNTGSATSCLKKLVGAHQVLSQSSEVLYNALKNVGLEMIDLEIVRGIAAGSSSDLPTFTEQSGHKALDLLLAEFDHRPAIQAELQVHSSPNRHIFITAWFTNITRLW